jgi:superfamily II DNA/RNA helicase
MRLVTDFLSKIYRRFYVGDKEGVTEDPEKDDKLQHLLALLKSDRLVKGRKILVFSEFRATARYLAEQLRDAGIANVEQVDSGRNVDNREEIIKRFAPYYNCFRDERDLLGETELSLMLKRPINVLISTDVLSEGLNLQDCSLIVNYDLHWNPVRLMQRIGRVDRRLNPEIELALRRPADLDGKIYFWNFLPPRELEDLLHLKKTLDGKILRINRTLGIESPLLTPDDEGMALKLFNERYEGKESIEELMSIERRHIEAEHRELWASLRELPRRLFSGKAVGDGFAPIVNKKGETLAHLTAHPKKGLFCCYRMPIVVGAAPTNLFEQKFESSEQHPDRSGEVRWYFIDAETGQVSEDLSLVWTAIRCTADTKRRVEKGVTGLADARKAIEKHIKNTYLRDVQAAVNDKPVLLAWMEIA